MFDSVRFHLSQEFSITFETIGWGHHIYKYPSGITNDYLEFRGMGSPTYTNIKYYPRSNDTGRPRLITTIGSVQKLTNGNNIQTCTDINLIIQNLNDYLRQIPGLSDIDCTEGHLRMIDFCENHYLGDLLPMYLQILNRKRYPHRAFRTFDDTKKMPHKKEPLVDGGVINGISYPSDIATLTLYDKLKECLDPRATGILRQESRLCGLKAIQKHTGLVDPKLKDITPEMAIKILTEDLQRLNLDKDIPTEQSVRQQLIDKHGLKKGQKLYTQLLNLKKSPSLTTKGIKEYTGYSSATVNRMKKELEAAGVAWDLSPATITLPKLEVKYQGEKQNNDKEVLSDTREAVTLSTGQKLDVLETSPVVEPDYCQTTVSEATCLETEKDEHQATPIPQQGNEQIVIQKIDESSVSSIDAAMFGRYWSSFTPNIPPEWLVVSPMQRFERGLEIRYGDDGSLLIYAGASSRNRSESDCENIFYRAGDLLIPAQATPTVRLDTDQNSLQFNVEKPDLSDILMVPQATLGPAVEMSSLIPDRLIWVGSCSKESEVYVKR